jgi:2-polyprenyl-6-methoxyphenol hydroxylase-like FAD-dependent oxidoreductase
VTLGRRRRLQRRLGVGLGDTQSTMPTPIPTASKSSGRALVIGGSLAGLFAGLLLRRGGFDVDIYERVHGALAGRGAGIVTHAMLEEALDAAGIAWHEDLGVDVATRRVYDLAGRLVLEWPYPQILTAWDRLYDMLRRAFPSERYHDGKELAAIETGAQRVTARFADGSSAEGDLLIGADGLRSTVRGALLPDIVPLYAGYAAWRALVAEAAMPRALHADLFMHMAFCLPPGEQILGYPVAGPGNDLRPGHRRYNLVWYRPAEPARALRRLLTDEAGVTHALSIPPPLISRAVIAEMRAAAETVLAPQFRDLIALAGQPILQAIYDIESPRMAFGRIALIGDAAFVARPHVGAGVTKAAQDALVLARALSGASSIEDGLAAMEASRLAFGRRIIARARELGACLQQTHATPAEARNAARFRTPDATVRETATLEFLTE